MGIDEDEGIISGGTMSLDLYNEESGKVGWGRVDILDIEEERDGSPKMSDTINSTAYKRSTPSYLIV